MEGEEHVRRGQHLTTVRAGGRERLCVSAGMSSDSCFEAKERSTCECVYLRRLCLPRLDGSRDVDRGLDRGLDEVDRGPSFT